MAEANSDREGNLSPKSPKKFQEKDGNSLRNGTGRKLQEKDGNSLRSGTGRKAEKSRKILLSDEEEDEVEDEIDENLEYMSGALGRLKEMGLAISDEVEDQSKRLRNVREKTEDVDTKVKKSHRKIKKVR